MSASESKLDTALSALRKRILSGELAAGADFPSVRRIGEEFGVTTGTAATVVTRLANEGLVITRHGARTKVREFQTIRRSSPSRLARERWGQGTAIQAADTPARLNSVDVVVGEVAAPDWVATPLGLDDGGDVVFRSRCFVVDDRPVQLATSYFPATIARGTAIMHTDTGPGGVYARLAETGHAPVHFVEFLRARMPLPDEATRLKLPPGTPVVQVTRHAFEEAGPCVEVNRMILDGSVYELDYAFDA